MVKSRRLAALVLTLLPLTLGAAHAGDKDPASGVTEDLHVQVATVFEQPIYLDNLTPHESIVEGNRKRIGDEAKFQEWLQIQRSRILRDLVFKMLSNAYMQENGITASEQEIDGFIKREKEVYHEVLNKYRNRLQELQFRAEQIHAEGKPIPAELDDQIKRTKRKIDNMERQNVDSMVISAKQRRLHDDVQRERVSKAIRAWKFNRLLHDQFGGRVIPVELTYQPYEAYAAWLQTQHDLGHFEITDEKLNADFWAYYNRQPPNAIEPFDGMWDQLRWAGTDMP
jgi:hypothetical protein